MANLTEKKILKEVDTIFGAVEYGLAHDKFNDSQQVAAFITSGLVGVLGMSLHGDNKSKVEGFVKEVDKIVVKYSDKVKE